MKIKLQKLKNQKKILSQYLKLHAKLLFLKSKKISSMISQHMEKFLKQWNLLNHQINFLNSFKISF